MPRLSSGSRCYRPRRTNSSHTSSSELSCPFARISQPSVRLVFTRLFLSNPPAYAALIMPASHPTFARIFALAGSSAQLLNPSMHRISTHFHIEGHALGIPRANPFKHLSPIRTSAAIVLTILIASSSSNGIFHTSMTDTCSHWPRAPSYLSVDLDHAALSGYSVLHPALHVALAFTRAFAKQPIIWIPQKACHRGTVA